VIPYVSYIFKKLFHVMWDSSLWLSLTDWLFCGYGILLLLLYV
jgi:hypothetical protein